MHCLILESFRSFSFRDMFEITQLGTLIICNHLKSRLNKHFLLLLKLYYNHKNQNHNTWTELTIQEKFAKNISILNF